MPYLFHTSWSLSGLVFIYDQMNVQAANFDGILGTTFPSPSRVQQLWWGEGSLDQELDKLGIHCQILHFFTP